MYSRWTNMNFRKTRKRPESRGPIDREKEERTTWNFQGVSSYFLWWIIDLQPILVKVGFKRLRPFIPFIHLTILFQEWAETGRVL